MDKLAFWKKKDDFADIGKDLGIDKDFGMDSGPSPDLGLGMDQGPSPQQPQQQPFQKYPSFNQSQGFSQPAYQPPQQFNSQPSFSSNDDSSFINSKNLEVISSKLDALKASVESMNQRLANIEAIARGEQEEQRKRRYY